MGLGELPIDAISRKKVGRQIRSPAFHEDRPINAFDCETATNKIVNSSDTKAKDAGKIYLLSYVYSGEEWGPTFIGNEDFSPLSADEIFSILVTKQTRQPAVNVWYNLDFDANALIGTVLSREQMTQLADTNTCEFTHNDIKYQMTYIKGKFLSIKDENRHTSTHYDISQFFSSSLDKAAENWLGLNKDDIDPTIAHKYDWDLVTKYAKQDAVLTQELWEKFLELGEKQLGIPFGKPISTGFIAMHVVFDQLLKKPNWGSTNFQDMARKSYHGGRFEVFRRGSFDSVLGLDINSAYPYHMAKMPDLGSCDIKITDGSIDELRNCDWGFVTATVTTDPTRNIQPFAVKNSQVSFPALTDYEITVTKDEFLFALENNYLLDYDIHSTGLVYENSSVVRPFSFLEEWYDDRNEHKELRQEKNDKHDLFQFILKVIMNSVYGKTCQVTEKAEYLPTDTDFLPDTHEYVTEGYEGDLLKGWFEAGDLFNPFYASYITANTRLQLHEAALNLDVEKDTVMFATDCIMIEDSAISQKQIDRMLEPETLGKWAFDYRGSAFVVGSGVYDVIKEDKLIKMAKRGFKEVTKNYDSWRQAASLANGKIELHNERPARFKEWLLHDAHPRPAEFFEDNRTLKPNFDIKRQWHKTANFESLLASNHASDPLDDPA